MMQTNFVTAGLDLGNGYVKGVLKTVSDTKEIGIPSCAFPVMNPSMVMPVDADEGIANAVANIFDVMDVSFSSNMIKDGNRRWIGKRAIAANRPGLNTFNLTANISKAMQDLSPILAFSCIAGMALQDYWNANHKLPTDALDVHTSLAVALPIEEYRDYRTNYKKAFQTGVHCVTIHNFVNQVRVNITVDAIAVGAEGASAQYAISSYGEGLYNELLTEAKKYGAELEGLQAKHLAQMVNIVGIDIGEGTVNFPVFTDGEFNPDASRSINIGFGNILDNSVRPLSIAGHHFNGGRKEIAEHMRKYRNMPKDDWYYSEYEDVVRIVQNESQVLVNEIITQFTDIMGSGIQVAYVYGGGAVPMRDMLYPALITSSRSFAGTKKGFPILYLGSAYAQILNREGLYIMADGNAKMLAQKQQTAAKK